jgi:benzoyl-CoA reductase/2-hydroxyglutaryl-CoA dehydratase subunit BcrC/BadD/HgdB
VSRSQVAFVTGQMQHLAWAIGQTCGKRLRRRHLAQSIHQANRVRGLLGELREEAYRAAAAPLGAMEMLVAEMLAIHYCSDRDETVAVLEDLLAEVRRRVAAGTGVLEAAAARVYWVNPVADLRAMNLLEECGGRVCGTDYMFGHALARIPTNVPPLEALARMALADPMVGPAGQRAEDICADMAAAGAEAAVISRIPGASHCATEGAVIAEEIRGRLALPVVEIEVPPVIDAVMASLKTRLSALVERVKERRER